MQALRTLLAFALVAAARAEDVAVGPEVEMYLDDEMKTCNMTAYDDFVSAEYFGTLRSVQDFWGVGTTEFTEYVLTNGVAMERAATRCQIALQQLKLDLAGRQGPVEDWNALDAMCSDYCLESDDLHNQAMALSHCECLELSTQDGDLSYHIEGDWCRRNSGRLLCNELDRCGVWDCRLGDFMCPRHEYNQMRITLRNLGSCSPAGRAAAGAGAVLGLGLLGLGL